MALFKNLFGKSKAPQEPTQAPKADAAAKPVRKTKKAHEQESMDLFASELGGAAKAGEQTKTVDASENTVKTTAPDKPAIKAPIEPIKTPLEHESDPTPMSQQSTAKKSTPAKSAAPKAAKKAAAKTRTQTNSTILV